MKTFWANGLYEPTKSQIVYSLSLWAIQSLSQLLNTSITVGKHSQKMLRAMHVAVYSKTIYKARQLAGYGPRAVVC